MNALVRHGGYILMHTGHSTVPQMTSSDAPIGAVLPPHARAWIEQGQSCRCPRPDHQAP
jgi:hypothetical protein